ncbi:Membrane carboxypeptidase (penicillin-binding protein) [Lachnospiraceae bacterium]|nr:Membrane carboxypeptidase (penicillin-binding protein) [Lachnospiraceae bacterium]
MKRLITPFQNFFFQRLRGNKVAKKKKKKKKTAIGVFFSVFLRLFAVILVVTGILGGLFLWHFYDKYIKEYDREAKETVMKSTREDFKRVEPTYIYDVDGNVIMKLRGEGDAAYLSYSDIPQYAVNAFIAVEDRSFWTNPGYDLSGIGRVLFYYIRTKGVEKHGASTITQQLAKNIYLSSEVTISRKLKEILMSKYLAEKYSKQDIMEFYVNNIYFANQYYGLEAASQGYFGKSASALSLSEVAYLCAIPNRPAYYDPVKYPDHALSRRDKILGDMLEEGLISQAQYDTAVHESITIMESSGSELNDYQATYAMDCAVRYLMKLRGFSFQYTYADSTEYENYQSLYDEMYQEQKDLLYTGGYKIYTTLNSAFQDELQASLDDVLSFDTEITAESGSYALQGAVTAIDNSNGKVVAIVGGRSNPSGSSNNLTLNRAYQSFRQPGSTIKPLVVYTPALENGYCAGSIVQNIDVSTAKKPGVNALTLSGTPMTLRSAVENSINGCAWQVLANLSPKTGLKHISDMEYRKIVPADYTLAASLGGLTNGVTTAEQASGYAALANHGVYRGQTCLTSIKNADGEEIYADSEPVQAYAPAAADTMVDIMKGVITNGTAKKMGWYSEQTTEAAGKTGTTNNSKDGWFCGVTPYYTVAVWVGYDTPRALESLYGSSYPASIWKQCMSALIEGEPTATFHLPNKMEELSANAEKYLPGRDASEELYAGYTVGDYRNDHNTGDAISAVLAQMGALSRLTDPNYDADIAALYSQCAASLTGVKDAEYAAQLQSDMNTAYAVAAAKMN